MRSKILGADKVFDVDLIPVSGGNPVPTLAQLQGYQAVLAFSDVTFSSAVGLGDVLADYVDQGGGVVLATFAFFDGGGLGIQGRLKTGGYLPFTTGNQNVATPVATLQAGGSGLAAIYSDRGTGPVYAARTFHTSEASRTVSILLNQSLRIALTAAAGNSFALGGELVSLDATNSGQFFRAVENSITASRPSHPVVWQRSLGTFGGSASNVRASHFLATLVAVVALRQPRPYSGRNGLAQRRPSRRWLRRSARRYASQREEFYHLGFRRPQETEMCPSNVRSEQNSLLHRRTC